MASEDLGALRSRVTPEMLSYYSEELARNASRGVVNQISDVKLLQGDLSEAWREGNDEYATVAMRYSLNDRIVDRDDRQAGRGRLPSEATELWTFRRAPRRQLAALGDPADRVDCKVAFRRCDGRTERSGRFVLDAASAVSSLPARGGSRAKRGGGEMLR